MTEINARTTTGELVAADDRVVPVLLDHGIDFCCKGDQTIQEACHERNVTVDDLLEELEAASDGPAQGHRYQDWDLPFLVDYIVNEHHSYARDKLLEIQALAEVVADTHGQDRPELKEIEALWAEVKADLEEHLAKEEEDIFPAINALAAASNESSGGDTLVERDKVEALYEDHTATARQLERLEELTDGFEAPPGACGATDLLYRRLAEFSEQTRRHVHLENHVLFPRAVPQPA